MVFSVIDNKLTCYDRGVILFGCGSGGKKVRKILLNFGKNIICFVDNDKEKWGSYFCQLPVKSLEEMKLLLKKNKYIVIQIASIFSNEIEKQLIEMGIESCRIISYWEFDLRISCLERYLYHLKKDISITDSIFTSEMKIFDSVKKNEVEENFLKTDLYNMPEVILINSAPKTGNTSLSFSLEQIEIPHIRAGHGCYKKYRNKEKLKKHKIKMILGVREPFSQFLSFIFEWQRYLWDQTDYWEKGGDVQKVFDELIEKEIKGNQSNIYLDIRKEFLCQTYFVEDYFDKEIQKVFEIDVYKHPFDSEKHYSIIKNNNIELFIYQLEYLSQLSDVLEKFLNIDNFKLLSSNTAESKWYNKYYKIAKENLRIRKSLLEQIYSHKYMKHFYSKKQIEIFMQEWGKNIIDG